MHTHKYVLLYSPDNQKQWMHEYIHVQAQWLPYTVSIQHITWVRKAHAIPRKRHCAISSLVSDAVLCSLDSCVVDIASDWQQTSRKYSVFQSVPLCSVYVTLDRFQETKVQGLYIN